MPKDIFALSMQVYECLTTIVDCHRRRILHGDVKPANFMLKEPLPDSLTGVLRSCVLCFLLHTAIKIEASSGYWGRAVRLPRRVDGGLEGGSLALTCSLN